MMNSKGACKCSDIGLLLIRVALGVVFLYHGVQKLGDMDKVVGFFGMLGFHASLAWFVAIVEAVGGAALILGVFVQIVGPALAIIMLVAIFKVKFGKGYPAMELDILLLLSLLGISATGPGKYSVLKHLCGCQKKCGSTAEVEVKKEGCCGGSGNCGGDCGCKK
jgi:putative oxidoreductase